jgi:uncharacterized membrane protein
MIFTSQIFLLHRILLRPSASFLAVACFLLMAQVVMAKPEFPGQFRTATGIKADSVVGQASAACKLCHSPSPPKLNLYGTDIKFALDSVKSKQLTSEILQVAGSVDSDGDGTINSTEVSADTLPGDVTSRPRGTQITSAPINTTKPAPAEETPGLWHPKTLFTPNHAQHPVIVHFPIALFLMSLCFDILGFRAKDTAIRVGLRVAAYFNLIAAALASVGAVITGILAWQIKYGGIALRDNLLYHLVSAICFSVILFLLLWLRIQYRKRPGAGLGCAYAVFSAAEFLLVSVAGHLGGALIRGG